MFVSARATTNTAIPTEESNTLLRLAAQQLLGNTAAAKPFLTSTRRQQGLMQVFHDFCVHDKSICRHCHFPDLVHHWTETSNGKQDAAV